MKKVLMLVMVLCFGLAMCPVRAELILNNGVIHELWYETTHDLLPDFDTLGAPSHTEVFPNFGQEPRENHDNDPLFPLDENFVVRNTTVILIPAGGTYGVSTASDDGSKLWIDGVLVVDNDGLHGTDTVTAEVELAMGAHTVIAGMFEKGGGNTFTVQASMPDDLLLFGPIPDQMLILPPTEAVYPENGQGSIPFPTITLEWAATSDLPAGNVSWKVYLGTTPAAGDPNNGTTYYIDETPLATPQMEVTGLVNDETYYWRADAMNADSNALWGVTWSFDTIKMKPIITGEPEDVKVGIGCDGLLTVVAISGENNDGGALEYQWFDASTDVALGVKTSSPDLVGGPGDYYCVVSNGYGDSPRSTTATISEAPHVAVGSLAQGMIGYWPFDVDGRDASGNGVDGVLGGEAAISPGKFGNALDMNGDNGNCFTGKKPSELGIGGNNPRSVSSWVYVRSWGSNGGIYDCGERANDADFCLRIEGGSPDNDNRWRIQYWAGDYDFVTTDATREQGMIPGYEFPSLNNWVHFVHTHDGSSTRIYANGRLIVDWARGTPLNTTDDMDWRIGTYGDTDQLDGLIDEVALWNRALTAEEAAAIYETGQAGKTLAGTSWAVSNIIPDGSVRVDPEVNLEVTWDDHPLVPCGAVTYDLLLVEDDGGEPNFAGVSPVATSSGSPATILAADLNFEAEYWLRVDVSYGAESEAGTPVYFEAIKRIPVITAQPQDVFVFPGETVEFSIEATSLVGALTYKWYKEVPGGTDVEVAVGNPGVLPGVDVDADDDGMYYCIAENDAGTQRSESARLEIKQLIGHWTLDEIGDSNEVADSSPFARHGIAKGDPNMPYVVPGVIGNALSFDGASQWVAVGLTASELDVAGDHAKSISAWVNAKGFNNGGIWDMGTRSNAQDFSLRTRAPSHGGQDHEWRAQFWGGWRDYDFNTDNTWNLYDAPESWNADRPAPASFPSKDAWVHFVLSYADGVIKIYGNGRLIVVHNLGLDTGDDIPFRIGAYGNGVDSIEAAFDGIIDDLRLYNYALSATEAAEHYVAVMGGPVCPEDPIYDFDGDCDEDFADFARFMAAWLECNLEPCDRW